MKLLTVIALACFVTLAVGGCKKEEPEPTKPEAMAKCPGCGMEMQAGAYCAKCNCVACSCEMVKCPGCNADSKEGMYCPKCNAFVFTEKMKCEGCGAETTKGACCEKCKCYVGVKGVGYCEKCKKPYPEATGCPVCKAKAETGT